MAKLTAEQKRYEAEERKWQAERDARTLREHAELSSNASRMKAATSVLRKEQNAISKALPKSTGGKKK